MRREALSSLIKMCAHACRPEWRYRRLSKKTRQESIERKWKIKPAVSFEERLLHYVGLMLGRKAEKGIWTGQVCVCVCARAFPKGIRTSQMHAKPSFSLLGFHLFGFPVLVFGFISWNGLLCQGRRIKFDQKFKGEVFVTNETRKCANDCFQTGFHTSLSLVRRITGISFKLHAFILQVLF